MERIYPEGPRFNQKHFGPKVLLPNNDKITVTSQGLLPLSIDLSSRDRNIMILPGLKSASLISIKQLCGDGCSVLLNEHTLIEVKSKKIILEGERNYSDGLWDIPICKTAISKICYAAPQTHLGLYPHRITAVANSTIVNVKKGSKKGEIYVYHVISIFQQFNSRQHR